MKALKYLTTKTQTSAIGLFFIFLFVVTLGAEFKPSYLHYIEAQLMISEGRFSEAIDMLKKTIKADPDEPAPYRDLAFAYLRAGDYKNAKRIADEIAKKFEDIDTLRFLSEVYVHTFSFKEAAYYSEKVLEVEPENEKAILYLANYYHTLEPQTALKYWQKLIALKPQEEKIFRLKLGETYERLKRYNEAIKNYNYLVEKDPSYKEPYLSLARTYEIIKDTSSAILNYKNYLKYDPQNLFVLEQLGTLYFKDNNITAAEETFKKILEVSTTSLSAHIWLGIISAEKKDIDAAINHFKEAVKIEPTAMMYQYLAELYVQKKDYKSAEFYLNKAIKENPSDPKLKFLLGLLYLDMERYRTAIKLFDETIKLKSDFYNAYFYAGVCYDRLKDFNSMRKKLEELIKINPDHALAKNYLAYSLAEKNMELDYAYKLIKEALVQEPENAAFIDTLGWIYYKKGDLQSAERDIETASTKTHDWEIYYHLGRIKDELNKRQEAMRNYFLSMRYNPVDRKRKKEIQRRIIAFQNEQSPDEILTDMKEAVRKSHKLQKIEAIFNGKIYSQLIWGDVSFLYPSDIVVKIGSGLLPVILRMKENLTVYPFDVNEFPEELLTYILVSLRDFFSGEIYNKIQTPEKYEYSGSKIIIDGGKYVFDRFTGDLLRYSDGNRFRWSFSDFKLVENVRLPTVITLTEKNKQILKIRLKKIDIADIETP